MLDQTQANSFIPYSAPPLGVTPQGVDFSQIAGQIASQILPTLPGLILGLLSANPTLTAQARPQSGTPFATGPQGLGSPGFNPQGFSPQGLDFSQIAGQIASQILPTLPGLILGLLSANPTLTAQARPQSATPFAASPPGVSPQGFNLGHLAQQIVGHVAPLLPGLVMSVLSTNPSVASQARPQGVAPQSLVNFGINTPFGGAGLGLFGASPYPGVAPQGLDLSYLAQQVASQVVPLLPGFITSVLASNPALGSQARPITH